MNLKGILKDGHTNRKSLELELSVNIWTL